MNKKRIVGVAVTVAFSMSILLSSNVDYNKYITPSIETSSSMEKNEIAQVSFDNNVQQQLDDNIKQTKQATEKLDKKIEDELVAPEVSTEEDNQETLGRERKLAAQTSRGGLAYNPREINHLKTPEVVAKEVMNGDYGNGKERKEKLESEGYNYADIQAEVIKILPKIKPRRAIANPAATRGKTITAVKSNNAISAFPHNTFKSYMAWTALSKSSPQGKLCARATKDPSTAIMMVNGRYLVALGFAYTNQIGEEIDVVMESGQVIPVIVGDWKAKAHTDQWNSASTNNGSIIEFIVSSNSDAARATNRSGSYNGIFPGYVKEFRK